MQESFNYNDICTQFLAFMSGLDIRPYDDIDIVIDGDIHRYRTHDDKPYHRSGAYCIYPEGLPAGFAQDWRKGIKENWHYDTTGLDDERKAYYSSEEFKKKAEQERREADERRKQEKLSKSEAARQLFPTLPEVPKNHPYLTAKHIQNYGFRYNPSLKAIGVPLKDISGRIMSIQWIADDISKHKTFFKGASLEGVFWSMGLDVVDLLDFILLGEGMATMAKVYELTGYPSIAAMSCYRLADIAAILHEAYPKCKIIICADNDLGTERERGYNPGLREANALVKRGLAHGVVYPEFTNPEDGTDWDDYAIKHGDKRTATELKDKIAYACMSDAEKAEYKARQQLKAVMHELDPAVQLPPQEFIGGIFPRKFVSLLIAPPGTGKTIFVQKFASDISIGGSVFDGFSDDEPERRCLILAGEAGYELLTRRAASMKWPVKSSNVNVLDQYEAENKNLDIMLDSPEGMKNLERLIDIYQPDVVFIDTFSSFHESDENKAAEMKPVFRMLSSLARSYDIAIVPVHHSRKRAAKERSMSLNQDDVIGSSILNRLVGLIIGIEPMKEDEKVLLVRTLKSWFSPFMPFTYTLKENMYGGTIVQTDLAPAGVNNSKAAVLFYLTQNFNRGEWFTASQIILSEINATIADWQLRRILADLVKTGKLDRRGAKKSLEFRLP